MHQEVTVNPKIMLLLTRQLAELKRKSPVGIRIYMNEADILDVQADIKGPDGTPYENGVFKCKLVIPGDFPQSPPKGYFMTKIFHPNVSEKGEICVNTLKKDWNPQRWSIYNILEVIKCLLIAPFPESALNEEAGKLQLEDYEAYFKHAKLITEIYAQPKDDYFQKQQMKIDQEQSKEKNQTQLKQQQQSNGNIQMQGQQSNLNNNANSGSLNQKPQTSLNQIQNNPQYNNNINYCSPQKENDQKMIEENQNPQIYYNKTPNKEASNLLLESNQKNTMQYQQNTQLQNILVSTNNENNENQQQNKFQNNIILSGSRKKQRNIPLNFTFTTNFQVPQNVNILQNSKHNNQFTGNNTLNTINSTQNSQQLKKEFEKKKWLKRI